MHSHDLTNPGVFFSAFPWQQSNKRARLEAHHNDQLHQVSHASFLDYGLSSPYLVSPVARMVLSPSQPIRGGHVADSPRLTHNACTSADTFVSMLIKAQLGS